MPLLPLLLLVSTVCPHAGAARVTGIVADPSLQRVDSLLQRMARLQLFSGQVLIARHDSILLHRAYGWADRDRCVPVTPTTLFDIGSIAKQFTGAAILRLEADGLLHTTDSLGRWLPGVPPDKRGITIAQLASHSSGLPRDLQDDNASFFLHGLPAKRDSIVQVILARPLEFAPGAKFQYSNIGYTLLAAIAERASGKPFTSVVRDDLWGPAGLPNTLFEGDARNRPAGTSARGMWDRYDDGSPRERPTTWFGMGGSQVVSTAADLLAWQRALWGGRVLAPDALRKLTTPVAGNYAYGWYVLRRPDSTISVIYHAGAHPNSSGGEFRYYPARGLVVVVLTNLRHWDTLMQEDVIANLSDFINARDTALVTLPPVLDPRAARLATGNFRLESGGGFTVLRDARGEAWLAPEGQRAFDLVSPLDTVLERVRTAAVSTRALIDSVMRAKCPAPRSGWPLLASGQTRPGQFGERFCAYRGEGPIEGIEISGVMPLPWSDTETLVYTRMRVGGRSRAITWRVGAEGPVKSWSSLGVPFPQALPLGALAGGDWVLYDWFRGRTLRVTISPKRLVLHLAAGDVVATAP